MDVFGCVYIYIHVYTYNIYMVGGLEQFLFFHIEQLTNIFQRDQPDMYTYIDICVWERGGSSTFIEA